MTEVISNTSPIQYLYQVGLLDLLPALFWRIAVPKAVLQELAEGRRLGVTLPDLTQLRWVHVRGVTAPAVLPLVRDLAKRSGHIETVRPILDRLDELRFRTDWESRWNDFRDCFTLEVGTGVGVDVTVRATDWLATGLGFSAGKKYGFAGRHPVGTRYDNNSDCHVGFPLMTALFPCAVSAENEGRHWLFLVAFLLPDTQERHGKPVPDLSYVMPADLPQVTAEGIETRVASILGINTQALFAENRGRGPGATLVDAFEVDVGATLIAVSGRVGFSLGQFLDFVLGWTTLDIAGNDAAK